jgi:Flp pilus assembly protein TadD
VLATVACGAVLVACAATSEEINKRGPVWEDPDADPYNFHRSVTATLLRTFQYPVALRTARKLVKLRSDAPEPYTLLARAHMGLRQMGAARNALARALALDDTYAPAHAELGALLDMEGAHRAAEKSHRRALALAPDEVGYHNNLGFCLYLQKRYWDAIARFRAALERDATARRVHNNLAFAYAEVNMLDRAYRHFRLAGRPAQASNNMGFVHEERGELERAYEYYLIALREDPALIQARRNLARICQRLGRPVPELEVQSTPPGEPLPPPAEPPTQPSAATEVES